jgi:hypothetical protein
MANPKVPIIEPEYGSALLNCARLACLALILVHSPLSRRTLVLPRESNSQSPAQRGKQIRPELYCG